MSAVNGKRQFRRDSASVREEDEPPTKRAREDARRRGDRADAYEGSETDRNSKYRRRSRSREHRRARYDSLEPAHSEGDDGQSNGRPRRRPSRSRSRSRDRRRRDISPRSRRNRSRSPARRQDSQYHPSERDSSPRRRGGRSRNDRRARDANGPTTEHGYEEGDDSEAAIRNLMGFSGFRSTKNTKVPGNNVYAVRKDKQIKARQYMNRVGGFNRPLSPGR